MNPTTENATAGGTSALWLSASRADIAPVDHSYSRNATPKMPNPAATRNSAQANQVRRSRANRTSGVDDDTEDLHRLLPSLHVARSDGLDADAVRRRDRRRRREDLAGLPPGLQPSRDVHGVRHHGVLEPAAGADGAGDDRPGVHPDADPDLREVARPALGVELALASLHRDPASQSALGVVGHRLRSAEHRHDGVAEELVEASAVLRHDLAHRAELSS